MGFFPSTPSFANLSFVDSPDSLTGHSYLLRTLRVFVGKRGLTCMQQVQLLSTYSFHLLSSSVCNFMHCRPIHLFPPGYGARRPPRNIL